MHYFKYKNVPCLEDVPLGKLCFGSSMCQVNSKSILIAIKLVTKLLLICVSMLLIPYSFSEESAIVSDSLVSDSLFFGEIKIISENEMDQNSLDGIIDKYSKKKVNNSVYDELTENVLSVPIKNGYYFPSLSLKSIQPVRKLGTSYLNPIFILNWGESVTIDTFFFEGLERTSNKLLLRETENYRGLLYRNATLKKVKNSLRRYSFLQVEDYDEIVKTKEGKYGLLLKLEENPDNEFSGVVGYVPPKGTDKGYFTGEIELKLLNLSGTGRLLSIYWSKVNRYSQLLHLKYFEPWIWKTNFFGEGEFQQVLRDTMVVTREFIIGMGKRILTGNLQINFNSQSSIPTPGGRTILGLNPTKTTMIGVEFHRDSRNNLFNPDRGYQLHLKGLIGNRSETTKEDKSQFQGEIDGEFDYLIKPQWVASLNWHFKGKWLSKGNLSFSEQFWFGGANSLRGYSQDFFSGSEIAWTSFELRWIIGDLSRVYIFSDYGYYKFPGLGKNEIGFPSSYGVGLRLNSRMGIIGLDYGFGKGDTFSTAKVHIHIENRF